jgi:hypothetical protein
MRKIIALKKICANSKVNCLGQTKNPPTKNMLLQAA